ncbi:MAG: response regulator [Lentisphaerae bacterium]|nr:response regulator [Lentisphaerota bacterium]
MKTRRPVRRAQPRKSSGRPGTRGVAGDAGPKPATAVAPPQAWAGAGRPRVLLVDDDATIRGLAEHHLGEAGFDVVSMSEGAGVVQRFLDLRPDAVLLDVVLPDADGFDLCRALRASPGAEHLPIVMLTSLNDAEAIRTAFDAGASEFVSKPANWVNEGYRLRYLLRAAANLRDLDGARSAIAQAEREWKLTFDAIDDAVLLLSPDLTILRANRAASRMSGRPLSAMVGRSCHEAMGCRRSITDGCPALKVVKTLAPAHVELQEYGREGRDVLLSAAPVFGDGGRLVSVVYSVKDITEFRELQKVLLHSQKMEAMGVLAAGVAHDFNNLLQGVLGWAELLSAAPPSPDELKNGLGQISDAAVRGRALTQQLLFTSRKAQGKREPVFIGPLVQEVATLVSRTQPKNIAVRADVPGDLWMVHADASHLHQALMNLVVNGAQAMPAGGSLRILAANVVLDENYGFAHPDSETGPHVMIAVSDTGTGIDKGVLSKIYDPFFTTKAPGKGTGLGLSIVFGIVRDHGGHICCYTEPGKGTTFRIYLPALKESVAPPDDRAAQHGAGEPASGEGRTVLVAEDEPLVLGLLVRLLESRSYRVVRTVNGREALDYYLAHRDEVSAFVLDMNMPVMTGEECMKELARAGCKAPVLLATGSLLTADREADLLRQARAIVPKPFHGDELLKALGRACAARPKS